MWIGAAGMLNVCGLGGWLPVVLKKFVEDLVGNAEGNFPLLPSVSQHFGCRVSFICPLVRVHEHIAVEKREVTGGGGHRFRHA